MSDEGVLIPSVLPLLGNRDPVGHPVAAIESEL